MAKLIVIVSFCVLLSSCGDSKPSLTTEAQMRDAQSTVIGELAKFKRREKVTCSKMESALKAAFKNAGTSFDKTFDDLIDDPEKIGSSVPSSVLEFYSKTLVMLYGWPAPICGRTDFIAEASKALKKAKKITQSH